MYQDIDVSTGPSGTLIATGTAAYKVSGFFNTYQADGDIGHVHLNFRNSAMVSIGTAEVTAVLPLDDWTQNFRGGLIPLGTASVRVSVFGTTTIGGGPDGYVDNVDFQVSNDVIQPTLELTISRDDGSMTLTNRTGGLENISGYSITSAFEALNPVAWRSIADNYDAGNPGPNQVDAAHNWSELTDPAVNDDLSEGDLEAGSGASLAHTRTVNLGNAGTWIQNPTEDLVFEYVSDGVVVSGITKYIGNGNQPLAQGDLNADGAINSADWVIVRTNQHTDLSGLSLAEAYRFGDFNRDKANDHADFVSFKTLYDAANGSGSFAVMLTAVPEPSTLILVLAAGLFALPVRRRATNGK
jgi:hypothetical protein